MSPANFLIPLLILLGLALVVIGVVAVVVRIYRHEAVDVSFRQILLIYCYAVTLVSIVTVVLGLASLANAGLSVAFGRDFSFQAPPVFARALEGPPGAVKAESTIEEQQQRRARELERHFRESLVQGLTLPVVGGLIALVHVLARRRLEAATGPDAGFFRKPYLALLLAVFGGVALVSLPVGLYEALTFWVVEADPESYRPAPGGSLANAIAFTPFWLYFLWATVREWRHSSEGAA